MAEADFRLMTEATGQRIAAALEALHLATVTGVKGNAEVNYRTGDVNITPANIEAVAKSGDTMTGPLNIRNDLTSYDLELIPPVGANNGGFIDFAYNGEEVNFTSRIIEDQRGVLNVNGVTFQNGNLIGKTNGYSWDLGTEDTTDTWVPVLSSNMGLQHRTLPSWLNYINTVPVDHGGTDATTPAQARANLGITPANIGVIFETVQIQFPANQNYVYVGHKSGYNLVQAMTTSNDSLTYINGIVDSHSVGWWTLFVSNPPTSTATYSMKLCWVKE